ncbi:MAG TPA: glycosyltransferase, partial [Candidatus Goldiibacteriota bacterium]|nr:glycosyltransferase [Candidatus Goldiibacteriota bacterium]
NLNIASCLDSVMASVKYMRDSDAVLLVAGSGPLRKKYEKFAAKNGITDRVIFLGQLKRSAAVNYIIAADICLVYYTDNEVNRYRASMKLREYMAMARPVVATCVGEIRQFRRYIYTSAPNPRAFAREIDRRLKKLDNRAKKGYKLIREKYDYGQEMRKFADFLKKLKGPDGQQKQAG